jgi:hypothetical protein
LCPCGFQDKILALTVPASSLNRSQYYSGRRLTWFCAGDTLAALSGGLTFFYFKVLVGEHPVFKHGDFFSGEPSVFFGFGSTTLAAHPLSE